MHDIYKQKCLVKSIYLVLQIKHCKKVRSSIGFKCKMYILWNSLRFGVSLQQNNCKIINSQPILILFNDIGLNKKYISIILSVKVKLCFCWVKCLIPFHIERTKMRKIWSLHILFIFCICKIFLFYI